MDGLGSRTCGSEIRWPCYRLMTLARVQTLRSRFAAQSKFGAVTSPIFVNSYRFGKLMSRFGKNRRMGPTARYEECPDARFEWLAGLSKP